MHATFGGGGWISSLPKLRDLTALLPQDTHAMLRQRRYELLNAPPKKLPRPAMSTMTITITMHSKQQ